MQALPLCRLTHLPRAIEARSVCPPVLRSGQVSVARRRAEAGHGAKPVHLLALWGAKSRGVVGEGRCVRGGRRHAITSCRAVGVVGRASGVGSLVNVLAVNVYGVGHESGTAIPAAGVALFQAEEFYLGLDTFENAGRHCDCLDSVVRLSRTGCTTTGRDGCLCSCWKKQDCVLVLCAAVCCSATFNCFLRKEKGVVQLIGGDDDSGIR